LPHSRFERAIVDDLEQCGEERANVQSGRGRDVAGFYSLEYNRSEPIRQHAEALIA